jgi:predicted transposase/invertase (TIGR01784 family)
LESTNENRSDVAISDNDPANPKYKDSFFTKLFSEPESILKLYNALSRSQYPLETPIEITTLGDVFFRGRYNDLSFIVDGKLVILIEQQASICPNVPVRLMIYLSKVYDKYIKKTYKQKIYSSQLVQVPRPEFIVLYNGTQDYPAEKTLNLSDLFLDLPEAHKTSGSLELTVRILNINKGHNESIVQESVELDGYVILVDEVRKNKDSGMTLAEAISKAVKDCSERKILTDFLEKYGSEVVNMLNHEFSLDEYGAVRWEEGILEGLLRVAKSMLQDGENPEKVSRQTGLPLERVYQLQPQ